MGFSSDCAGRGQSPDYHFYDSSGFVSLQEINVWIELSAGKILKIICDLLKNCEGVANIADMAGFINRLGRLKPRASKFDFEVWNSIKNLTSLIPT